MTDPRALLRASITVSGLSVSAYASDRLARSTRCLNYWLSGEHPIPPRVATWLERQPEYPQALTLLNATPTEEPKP